MLREAAQLENDQQQQEEQQQEQQEQQEQQGQEELGAVLTSLRGRTIHDAIGVWHKNVQASDTDAASADGADGARTDGAPAQAQASVQTQEQPPQGQGLEQHGDTGDGGSSDGGLSVACLRAFFTTGGSGDADAAELFGTSDPTDQDLLEFIQVGGGWSMGNG